MKGSYLAYEVDKENRRKEFYRKKKEKKKQSREEYENCNKQSGICKETKK